jgi:predicted RND superfamily exporter protein
MWTRLASFILRRRIPILVFLGIMTAFMGYMGKGVVIQYTLPQLLPDSDSTLIAYKEFRQQYGKEPTVIVLGIDQNPLESVDLYNAWYKLGKKFKAINGVDTVVSVCNLFELKKDAEKKRFDLSFVHKGPVQDGAELDRVRSKIESLPFYRSLLYNDSTGASLMALSLEDAKFNSKDRMILVNQIMETTDQFAVDNEVGTHLSGLPFVRSIVSNMVENELQKFIFLALIVTVLILLFFFRDYRVVLISLVVVGMAVIWSLGTMGIMGYEITILTSIIPPLLIVIGVPNCVYLINKYHSEYLKHKNRAKSLTRVVVLVGRATFMTNATTAAGFGTFMFTQSILLVEFGLVASINILLLFVFSLCLIPIFFSLIREPKEKNIQHLELVWMRKIMEFLAHIVEERRPVIYAVTLVLIIIAGYGMSKIESTGNLVDDLPKDHFVLEDLGFFEEHFTGVMPFEITVDAKKPKMIMKTSTMKRLEKTQDLVESYDEFTRPMSIVEGVKFIKQGFYGGDPPKYQLINSREKAFFKPYIDNFGGDENMLSPYLDSTRQRARITLQMADVGTKQMSALLEDLKPRIDSILPPEKYEVEYTGTSVVYLMGANYLVRNLFISLLLAILVVGVIMALLFSSARMILISIFINVLPLIITAAMMGYFGIPIKPSTILVFSIAFGISVDDTIHYLAKYRQELRHQNDNIGKSVHYTLSETGVSMFYTSVILFFGFSVFDSSQFGGTQALGILVSLTLFVAMIANLVLLPSMLLSLEKSIISKSFREPLLEIFDEEEDIDYEELEVKKGEMGSFKSYSP